MSLTAKRSLVVKRETCHECLQNANNVVGITAMPDMTGIFIQPTRSSSRLSCLSHSSRSSQLSRLRSTTYLDGTSSTNHYSCCRLLWSRDREGRTVLRSAVTGEDQLYYAEEEVYLADISTNRQYRVTQHFLDALGRETNTVVYAGSIPGEAVVATASSGKVHSQVSTAYPRGDSDYSIHTDERGKVTVRRTDVRSFRSVRTSEKKNISRFEARLIEIARTLPDGENIVFYDYFDTMNTANVFSEMYYASGTFTISSYGEFKLSRTGCRVAILGNLEHRWHDDYDWHVGLSAYISGFGNIEDADAQRLEDAGLAQSFKMLSLWSQKLDAAYTIRKYWFNSSTFSWGKPEAGELGIFRKYGRTTSVVKETHVKGGR